MPRLVPSAAAVLFAAALAVPAGAQAQQFKVQKWNIGGEGGTDYLTAEPGTGRVFVSRSSHVMVVDGRTGKVLGDIPNTPRMHGIALAAKAGHGFISNGGDSTVTMFDLKTLAELKRIKIPQGGQDGITYDDFSNTIILTNHSRPIGTVVALNAETGDIVATVNLESSSPEGAVSDGMGMIYVNNEGTSTIQAINEKTWTVTASWPLAPCEGPTGIAYDVATDRVISGCSEHTVVSDPKAHKVVATIANGGRVDALGWDQMEQLIYVPSGADSGTVTVARQEGPDQYTVIATVRTVPGAKTITVDPVSHTAYLFQPEYAPAPAGAAAEPPSRGRGRGPRGPMVAAWFIAITH